MHKTTCNNYVILKCLLKSKGFLTYLVITLSFFAEGGGQTDLLFPENVIEISQVIEKIWRFTPSVLFWFFDNSLLQKPNGATTFQMITVFFSFNLLWKGCLTIVLSYIDIRFVLLETRGEGVTSLPPSPSRKNYPQRFLLY